jgi:hypothetical protein
MITGAPWYVSNQTLHEDLKIPLIQDIIKSNINKYKDRTTVHENRLIKAIHPNLRRKKTQENLARRPS